MISRAGDLAGGRVLVWAGRAVLWSVVLVVGVTGVRGLMSPPATAGNEVTAEVASFPERAGLALAAQVTVEYLTWGATDAADRQDRLCTLLGPSGAAAVGSPVTDQQVLHVIPAELVTRGRDRAVATVSAQVLRSTGDAAEPRWLHLEVPLHAVDGVVAADGAPVFVGASSGEPPTAMEPPAVGDPAVAAALSEPLGAFFRAYGAGDPAELDYLTTPQASVTGLDGAVVFDGLERTAVLDREGETRTAVAEVRWRVGDTLVHQSYRLRIVRQGGRWYVADLSAHTGAEAHHEQPDRQAGEPTTPDP